MVGAEDLVVARHVERRVARDGHYTEGFRRAFGTSKVTPERIVDALEAYVLSIRSGDSAYDRYAAGDPEALDPAARRGLALFTGKANCASCHDPARGFTDGDFHNTGVGAAHVPPGFGGDATGRDGGRAMTSFIGFADLGSPLQQKVQEALVQHPDANAIAFPADAMLSAGIEAGLRGAGRYDDIFIGLGEGDPAVMDKIRNGTLEGAGVGVATDWEAYAAMNNLNRLFQGEEPVSSGIGLQAFDQDNNIPPSGIYKPPIDFRPAYLSAWGS